MDTLIGHSRNTQAAAGGTGGDKDELRKEGRGSPRGCIKAVLKRCLACHQRSEDVVI